MALSTKKMLAQTLKNQLANKSFDSITVKDLVEKSGVNRKTFYYNYEDKFALAKEAVIGDLQDCLANHFSPENWKEGMAAALHYIQDNKAMFWNLRRSSYWGDMDEALQNLTIEVYKQFTIDLLEKDIVGFDPSSETSATTVVYLARFYATSVSALIDDWFRKDCEQTPEEFADQADVMFDMAITRSYLHLTGAIELESASTEAHPYTVDSKAITSDDAIE